MDDSESSEDRPRRRPPFPLGTYYRTEREHRKLWWVKTEDGWFHIHQYNDSRPDILHTPDEGVKGHERRKSVPEPVIDRYIRGIVHGYLQCSNGYNDTETPWPPDESDE